MGIVNATDPLLLSRAPLPASTLSLISRAVPSTTRAVVKKLRNYDHEALGRAFDGKRWRVNHTIKGSVLQVKGGSLRLPSSLIVIERASDGDVSKVLVAMPRMRHLDKAEQSRLVKYASDAILSYCGIEVIRLPPPRVDVNRDPTRPAPLRFLFRAVGGLPTAGVVAEDGFGHGAVLVWKAG